MTDGANTNSKFIPVLVILLIVASFFIGSLYTRVNLLEKGIGTGTAPTVAGNNPAGDTAGQAPTAPSGPVDVDVTDAQMLGNANAKVAVVEFTDYQCPFCGQLFSNTFPELKKNYIDTGKIRYYLKDFPLTSIHPKAQKAAEAANCAIDQKKFWEFHDLLFKNQTALEDADLKKYAVDLGLNAAAFNSCLDSGKYTQKVTDSVKAGEKYGVRGTPSSWVGPISGSTVKAIEISGAQPFSAFQTEIDKALQG